MKPLIRALRRAAKLVLWYQFLRKGMFPLLARYYSGVWLAMAVVVGLSLSILFASPELAEKVGRSQLTATVSSPGLVTVVCVGTIIAIYLLSRLMGPIPAVLISTVGPAILIITPTVVLTGQDNDPREGFSNLSTGDTGLLMKGIAVCGSLVAVTYLTYRLAQVPCSVLGLGKMPFRWMMTAVVVVVGLLALELMRITSGIWPSFRPPWQALLHSLLCEPAWPYALAVWLWITLGALWAYYDDRLIPYLLHRIGHTWAPKQLGMQETYMVDSLLTILDPRSSGSSRDSSQGSGRSSRRRQSRQA